MRPAAKLGGFAAIVALAFGGAALAGDAIDPEADTAPAHAETGADAGAHGAEAAHGAADAAPRPVRGLAVGEDGLRLVVDDPELRRDRPEELRFRIVGEDNRTVSDFEVEHEKRMHLILARRDLTGFQHLHPEQDADGSWHTRVRLPAAGSYRMFADFSREEEPHTLASDLRIDGRADLRALPAASPVADAGEGYEVRREGGGAHAGEEAELGFTVLKDGEPVRVEEYLGAGGHLVALREGDLAFLHVHPTEHGDSIAFEATFPTTGRYRLFLQFKHDGRVRTAAFTEQVR